MSEVFLGSEFDMADFLPRGDAQMLQWATHFAQNLSEDPAAAGLTAAQVAVLLDLRQQYAAAYYEAIAPDTRSLRTVFVKDNARRAMVDEIRRLARVVQAAPVVTDKVRLSLGLTIRGRHQEMSEAQREVPASKPRLQILAQEGHVVSLRLFDTAETSRAGRARDALGATIYCAAEADAPERPEDWINLGSVTRVRCTVRLPDAFAPGTSVWLCAAWVGHRLTHGPFSNPVQAYVQFGGSIRFPSLAA